MSDDDWQLAQGTVDFRNEGRRAWNAGPQIRNPESKRKEAMPRTILVHLNVTVNDFEGEPPATADEIAKAILGAIEVGSDSDFYYDTGIHEVVCPLAEEI